MMHFYKNQEVNNKICCVNVNWKLKNESWDNITNHTDVNESFNLFLNTF